MRRAAAIAGPALALAALFVALPAGAQSVREARFAAGMTGCYLRSYDAAHLKAHPGQQVAEMVLGPDAGSTDAFAGQDLRLRLGFRLRDGAAYQAIAYCEPAGAVLDCFVEGDGGSFRLEAASEGRVRLSVGPIGVTVEGERDFAELAADRGDDRVFLLPPVPADACP